MSQQELEQQYEAAKKLVADWPEWKLRLLENSSKPTVSVPRTPIISQINSEGREPSKAGAPQLSQQN